MGIAHGIIYHYGERGDIATALIYVAIHAYGKQYYFWHVVLIISARSVAHPTCLDEAAISDLIQQRQTARQQSDFATADDIRDQLAAVEITVVDQPAGAVRWHWQ